MQNNWWCKGNREGTLYDSTLEKNKNKPRLALFLGLGLTGRGNRHSKKQRSERLSSKSNMISSYWCMFPINANWFDARHISLTPERTFLETYEQLLKPNTGTRLVNDSFVYQWIIERWNLIKATDVAGRKSCSSCFDCISMTISSIKILQPDRWLLS